MKMVGLVVVIGLMETRLYRNQALLVQVLMLAHYIYGKSENSNFLISGLDIWLGLLGIIDYGNCLD